MNQKHPNPFPTDPDRHEIWEILMRRDFESFLANDWELTAPDFHAEEFQGIDGGKVPDPDQWQLKYADLATYRDEWLRQAEEFQSVTLEGVDKLDFLFQTCTLSHIELRGERAVAHKKFDGRARTMDGHPVCLLWQTLYFLRKIDGCWKVTGFVGYLPNPMP
jgi:hypothetical protein